MRGKRTICTILQRFHFHTCPTFSAIIFRVFPDVLPREVRAETVDFASVVSDEEDEVFRCEVAGSSAVGQRTSLEDLRLQ